MAGCGYGLSQKSASAAVQPDVAERYALAAFAESQRAASEQLELMRPWQTSSLPDKSVHSFLGGPYERAESAGGGSGGEIVYAE